GAVSLVFPDLSRELSAPFMALPHPESPGEGFIEENGSRLVRSIVEFGEKRVREVMVPRIDVFAVDSRMTVARVRRTVSRSGHSRVPVYEGTIDRVIGMLYVKDLVDISDEDAERTGIEQLAREAYFVPEGKKIDDLLRDFRMRRQHMAVVVDEYGGTSGIVTLEDILEEIVGEITDEYDRVSPLIRRAGEASYLIEGRTPLEDLRETLGIDLQSEEVDTLGGLLYDLLGRVPSQGEQIESDGIVFRVERLEGQRIAEVLGTLPGPGGA
ncbi:MAG: hemolysin family protein, partial [Candidatus Krumholzibacteria bacterium]|nr:hemolysin family protein [Candidatus Krumholzibacteria bacterium]